MADGGDNEAIISRNKAKNLLQDSRRYVGEGCRDLDSHGILDLDAIGVLLNVIVRDLDKIGIPLSVVVLDWSNTICLDKAAISLVCLTLL